MLRCYSKPLCALGLLGMLAGAYGIFEALVEGTHATGLGSYTPWGLGVVVYLFFLGLSAGGLLLTFLTKVFGLKEYAELEGLAAWTVLVTEVCAGVSIATDLGRMGRMWRFVGSPGFSSPMMWMFVFFNALLAAYVVKILFLKNRNVSGAAAMSWLSMPIALLFYGTNGFFFAVMSSHPVWNSGLVPVFFVVAALLTGGGLLAFLAWGFGYDEKLVSGLGRATLLMLVLFMILEALHFYTGYQGARAEVVKALDHQLFGPNALAFWGGHVAVGCVLPLILLMTDRSAKAAALAGVLVVIGILASRWGFTMSAQTVPMLPGLDQAWQHPRLTLEYVPTLGEWLVSLFVTSLAVVGLSAGPGLFPFLFAGSKGGSNVQG